jgi:hypothetical protein
MVLGSPSSSVRLQTGVEAGAYTVTTSKNISTTLQSRWATVFTPTLSSKFNGCTWGSVSGLVSTRGWPEKSGLVCPVAER